MPTKIEGAMKDMNTDGESDGLGGEVAGRGSKRISSLVIVLGLILLVGISGALPADAPVSNFSDDIDLGIIKSSEPGVPMGGSTICLALPGFCPSGGWGN